MQKKWMQILSILLVMVLCLQMLPISTFAETIPIAESSVQENASSPEETTQPLASDTGADAEEAQIISVKADIVGEDESGRTEYSKQFRLSNGLHVAAMYNDAVHYEKDGRWEEIDNTLQTKPDGSITNTAGVWSVSFPQQLSGNKAVTVTKDGYTLSFAMAGELRQPGNLEVASLSAEQPETFSVKVDGKNETFSVNAALATSGQIQAIDMSKALAEAEHKEFVLEKNSSQLRYSDIYTNTDVQYDLKGNQLKESIVMESYNSTLRGYRYTLNTDGMIPVLDEEGNITFFDGKKKNVVMVMPAPFLVDAAEVYNYDVQVNLTGSGSTYTLTYLLPQQWLAEADRAWPVILDPVVKAKMSVSNVRDTSVGRDGSLGHTKAVLECGVYSTRGPQRIFLMYQNLPALTSADVIVGAKLRMYKPADSTKAVTVEVHKVLEPWTDSAVTWEDMPDTDSLIEDYARVETTGFYRWDITNIVRGWYEGQNTGMMFKVDDATEADDTTASWRQFYSAQYAAESYMPYIFIYFRNNNGIEDYWDYSTASVGRAGIGYVNNYTGNMTFIRSDIGFGGNLMPVSINHIYNTNDIAKNDYGAGYGWRTSFNQSVVKYTDNPDYYIWTDGDGTEHYFKYSTTSTYKDEDGLELTLKVGSNGNKKFSIKDKTGNASYFDTNGRLTLQQNNQATKSSITVTYTTDTGNLIDTITDGAGRVYKYNYTNGLLTSIECKRTDGSVIDSVSFAYDSAGRFTTFTDLDGKTITYTYKENGNLLESATDVDGYKLTYTYSNGQPSRVASVEETDDGVAGGTLAFSYAHNQTAITDHNGNTQLLQFNNNGNLRSTQDGEGRAQYANYATNGAKDDTADTAKKNQLTMSSKMQNTVTNLVQENSFENFLSFTSNSTAVTATRTSEDAYMGNYSMKLVSTEAAEALSGVYSNIFLVDPGETITLSAYIKTTSAQTRLGFHHNSNGTDYQSYLSDPLDVITDWDKKEYSFTNKTGTRQEVCAYIFTPAAGTTYVDNVQVERTTTASRFNLLANGDFSTFVYNEELDETGRAKGFELTASDMGWTAPSGQTGYSFVLLEDEATTSTGANQPAPKLTSGVLKIEGSPTAQRKLSQTLHISGAEGDAYIIGGWAKADSVPLEAFDSRERQFGIRLVFNNTDGSTTKTIAQFNPDAGSDLRWQFASEAAVAKKAYSSITVELLYFYNANIAYFDGIQLLKEEFGTSYAYDNDGNITAITDLLKQNTKYTHNSKHELTKEVLPTGLTRTYTYDGYHNVLSITSSDGTVQAFTYDDYGNKLSESISGTGTGVSTILYGYSENKNYLTSVTDASGETTQYIYNEDTGVQTAVRYPGDTEATQTNYSYDAMYRTTGVSADTAEGLELSAAYAYTNDYLTSITTPKTTYTFEYGDFGLRTAIKVGGTTLASYDYTEDENKYLEKLAYGNDDSVEYEYDDLGRVIAETHNDVITDPNAPLTSTITYRYDNDGELAEVYDSATGITTRSYFDFSGKEAATEQRKVINGVDTLYLRLSGTYDEYGRIKTKTHKFSDSSFTDTYTYNADSTIASLSIEGIGQITYGYDGLRRVTGATSETEPNSRTFTYRTLNNGADTTSQITKLSYPVMQNKKQKDYDILYEYDARGNISQYKSTYEDNLTYNYTYDTQNQLLSVTGSKTYAYTYDNAGNILTANKNGTSYSYSYGNSAWGDLLTRYVVTGTEDTSSGQISYDKIGNPTSYYNGWNFAWNGRKMTKATKDSDTLTFAYNADGLRTSKTVNGVTYQYYYADGKLIRQTDGTTTLDFFYDANGFPYIMKMGNTVYYYITNAQGDVIRVVDIHGNTAAYYKYDPYGKVTHASGTHANINPLKYRGYLHDTETGFYYLQSRYYDPETGRFINADNYPSTGQGLVGNNMFVYCGNNPISRIDISGEFFNTICGAIVGGIVAALTVDPNGKETWEEAFLRGAVTGAIAGAGLDICIATGGIAAGVIVAGVAGAAAGVADTIWEAENNERTATVGEVVCNGLIGGSLNVLFGAAGRVPTNITGNTPMKVGEAICKNTIKSITNKSGKVVAQKVASEFAVNTAYSALQAAAAKVFSLICGRMVG